MAAGHPARRDKESGCSSIRPFPSALPLPRSLYISVPTRVRWSRRSHRIVAVGVGPSYVWPSHLSPGEASHRVQIWRRRFSPLVSECRGDTLVRGGSCECAGGQGPLGANLVRRNREALHSRAVAGCGPGPGSCHSFDLWSLSQLWKVPRDFVGRSRGPADLSCQT
jgi:hypothetical protein